MQADPNTEAVESILRRTERDIIRFAKGVDTEAESLGAASGVALKFRYSGLDNDANIMEAEFQYSLEMLLWFVAEYLKLAGKGDFTKESVNIVFNRDQITNELEIIQMCKASAGIMPDKQIREQHPWFNEETEQLWEKQVTPPNEYDDIFPIRREKGGDMNG